MQRTEGCWEAIHLVSGLLVSILERRKMTEEMLGNDPAPGSLGQTGYYLHLGAWLRAP